jgi:hypothetical protein
MFLNEIPDQSNPSLLKPQRQKSAMFSRFSGCGEGKLGEDRRFHVGPAVRASRTAGFGAGAKRFIHDFLDGAGAPAALGAATKTSVNLPRCAWRHLRDAHDGAHVVVGEDVAGTNDHGMETGSLNGLTL